MTENDKGEEATASQDFLNGALAGIMAGVVASFAMDRFQAAIIARSSSGGETEPATEKAARAIVHAVTGSDLPPDYKPLAGQVVHYGLGIALGAAYGIAAERQPLVTAGFGTAFGIAVTVLLDEITVPAAGLGPPPWKTAPSTHLYTLLSHLVFGTMMEATRRIGRTFLEEASRACRTLDVEGGPVPLNGSRASSRAEAAGGPELHPAASNSSYRLSR